jgi:hypothetical protein
MSFTLHRRQYLTVWPDHSESGYLPHENAPRQLTYRFWYALERLSERLTHASRRRCELYERQAKWVRR